jgi:GntR family transcriptional regulator, transcriptional repressor for pyruvate dehydrogenase complex
MNEMNKPDLNFSTPLETSHTAASVKLSDFVYAKIAGRIGSGEYAVDSRLPPENDLAEMLGVSRPVIREALARLRNDGLVLSRRGSGTYVQRSSQHQEVLSPISALTSIADMRRCFEFRIGLESEAAFYAALGLPKDRQALIDTMAELEADLENGKIEPASDFAFHSAVCEATGNRFFRQTIEALRPSIATAMGLTPNFMSVNMRDRLRGIHEEHVLVFRAIMANDAEGAKNAMRSHLTRSMSRVFEGTD